MLSTVYEFLLKARNEDKMNPTSMHKFGQWLQGYPWSIDKSDLGWKMDMKRTNRHGIEFACSIDRIISNRELASILQPLCEQMKSGLQIINLDSGPGEFLYDYTEEDQESSQIINIDMIEGYLNSHLDNPLSFEFTFNKMFNRDDYCYDIILQIYSESIGVTYSLQRNQHELGSGWQLDASSFVVMIAANIIEKSNFPKWIDGLRNFLMDHFDKDVREIIIKFI